MKSKILFVYITCATQQEAQSIARQCLSEKLAACANIYPEIHSIYEWEGEMQSEIENVLILKTIQENSEKLTKRIKELHSYECPCITAFEATSGFQGYFDWIEKQVRV